MLDTLKSKDQQVCADFIHEGVVKLSAIEMNRVLQECGYEHQRGISDRHVDVLADLIKRDKWQPKSQIDFALFGGRLILVNGYHRGYAQVRAGKAIAWSIAIHPVRSEGELRTLYFAFDTNVRPRGGRDILGAYEFASSNGLSVMVAESLYRGIPLIASRFHLPPSKWDLLTSKAVDRRLAIATEYAKAGARYGAAIEHLYVVRKRKFLSGAMTAVGAVTFRYQSETAWQFWSGVANNDGLKRGDPRLALVMDLASRKITGGTTVHAFGPAMVAWNAFFNDKSLTLIKIYPETFVPVIDGTPFDGTPVKD